MTVQADARPKADTRYFISRYLTSLKLLFIIMLIMQVLFGLFDATFFYLNGYFIDEFIPRGKNADFLTASALFLILIVYLFATVKLSYYVGVRFSQTLLKKIREDAFNHLQKQSFSYFDKNDTGDLITRVTTDASNYANALSGVLPNTVYAATFITGASAFLLYLNWKMASIIFAVIPLLLFLGSLYQKKILAASRRLMACNSKLTTAFVEGIAGAKTIRSLVLENDFIDEFKLVSTEQFFNARRVFLISAFGLPLIGFFLSLDTGLLIWFGSLLVLDQTATIGVWIVMLFYAGFLFEMVGNLIKNLGVLASAKASQERLYQLLTAPIAVGDSDDVTRKIALHHHDAKSDLAHDGEHNHIQTVEFKNVSFHYQPEEPVLKEFNLRVNANESIALVGETGGGKSTVISLLCRFYEPVSGEILINGQEYRQRSLDWYQSKLGIVLQTPHLFAGTVRENIQYGDFTAPLEKVIEAATLVNAHPFIMEMKDGYESQIGAGGSFLSAGQRQLLSFARAILANPAILVMDEATASVDPETERLIQQGMLKVLSSRISFVIAHRLSTIRRADNILYLEQGRIIEQGDHDTLVQQNGPYKKLYDQQFRYYKEREILGKQVGFI